MEGFKKFLMQGNVIELAVAVVIGTAFTAVVTGFVEGIINPMIAQLFQADDIANAQVGIFKIGLVIAALINFVLVAAVVYFALVLPMAKLKEHSDRRKGISPDEPVETDVDILHDIRDLLRAQQTPGTAPRA
ncbi:large conductance mechanosensitive channel protein MscL [Agrococcus baldri]|uniref:Large conductance mechanosensitive channel protein MscL n=1 Tax=Agrococcus baldri TaxID=153730 RepID=A0AA87RHS6_9MICO|nr:large conductance mechanosensitive channel protein MscL [Agrococcus baldri]GEK79733.1 large conductance mechanosensitive channel protein MscL [Agrococcus baldri]